VQRQRVVQRSQMGCSWGSRRQSSAQRPTCAFYSARPDAQAIKIKLSVRKGVSVSHSRCAVERSGTSTGEHGVFEPIAESSEERALSNAERNQTVSAMTCTWLLNRGRKRRGWLTRQPQGSSVIHATRLPTFVRSQLNICTSRRTPTKSHTVGARSRLQASRHALTKNATQLAARSRLQAAKVAQRRAVRVPLLFAQIGS
jgi:hypothetical protein